MTANLRQDFYDAWRAEYYSLNFKKALRDLVSGLVVSALSVVVAILFHFGTEKDWQSNPFAVILAAGIFALPLLGGCLFRFARVLLRVYRERPDVNFRDSVHSIIALIAGGLIFFSLVSIANWLNSPHFKLGILTMTFADTDGMNTASSYVIGHYPELAQPNTVIDIPYLELDNTGTLSPANHWTLEMKTRNGDVVRGYPSIHAFTTDDPRDPKKAFVTVNENALIFVKANSLFKGSVIGAAAFVLDGVGDDIVRQVGTELTISCDDNHGRTYKTKVSVPAVEMTLKPLP